MRSGAIVLFVGALCQGAVLPIQETDLQLTASDADTGNWTANLGDIQVNIEHNHEENSNANSNGSWTLGISRYNYDKDSQQDEEDEARDNSYMTNDIPVDEFPSKEDFPPQNPPHVFGMLPPPLPPQGGVMWFPPPPPPPAFRGYGSYDTEEVVTDPDDFQHFIGVGWFKLDDRPMSWVQARDACQALGAHLAVPDTQDKVSVFLKLFQRRPEIPSTAILRDQVYIGVSDPDRNRVFTTVEGKPFNPGFPIWFLNEPDNAPPGEDCVTFHMEGRTRDVPCFYQLPFICERDVPQVY